jgi:hypothetical protein
MLIRFLYKNNLLIGFKIDILQNKGSEILLEIRKINPRKGGLNYGCSNY